MADFIVTTLDDELDPADTVPATADPDDLSLREALALANGDPTTADTIRFADSLAGGTLTLAHGELIVSGHLTIDGDIDGDGTPDITVDADSAWRAFEFPPALDTARVFNVTSGISTLNGLVITGGLARAGDGGGVRVGEGADVTIAQSVVAGEYRRRRRRRHCGRRRRFAAPAQRDRGGQLGPQCRRRNRDCRHCSRHQQHDLRQPR